MVQPKFRKITNRHVWMKVTGVRGCQSIDAKNARKIKNNLRTISSQTGLKNIFCFPVPKQARGKSLIRNLWKSL